MRIDMSEREHFQLIKIRRILFVLMGMILSVSLIGMSGCGNMAIGDKARIERYLEEKYGGDFEVRVPEGSIGEGTRLHMPAWAYRVEDPTFAFRVVKGEDDKGWADFYPEDLAAWQAKQIVDDALRESGLKAVSEVIFFLTEEQAASVTFSVDTDLRELLAKDTTPILEMYFKIVIADKDPGAQDLERKLTQAFKLIDERMYGKEDATYSFYLVETDDFDAFKLEVDTWGVSEHSGYDNATVISQPAGGKGGVFTHQGFRKPLSESISALLDGD
jgi:hypothetical protein